VIVPAMSAESLAVVLYAAFALAILVWVIVAIKRQPYSSVESLLLFVNLIFTKLLWRASVPRALPIGLDEGAVIVANHCSSVDPFFIQLAAGRKTHWMVTRESYDSPVSGWLMKITGSIPVSRRGVDTAATKQAIRISNSGNLVGIFPEGRINQSDDFMLKVRPGAAMIALKADVPLLPCYIEGAPYRGSLFSPFVTPAKVRVYFGPPIDVSEFRRLNSDLDVQRELMRLVIKEIARLAGREEYEPVFAGRKWILEHQ
jgi:1-acyl-sn-glycerol-3-phosphate acyltransferase